MTASSPTSRVRFDIAAWAQRVAWVILGAGAWATIAIARWLHPDARGFGTHQQLGLPPCAFTALTHVPCPGCGLTTSFAYMAHGHLLDAFRAHLMGPLLFGITVWLAFYAPFAALRGRPLRTVLEARPAFPVLMLTAGAGVLTFVLRVVG